MKVRKEGNKKGGMTFKEKKNKAEIGKYKSKIGKKDNKEGG